MTTTMLRASAILSQARSLFRMSSSSRVSPTRRWSSGSIRLWLHSRCRPHQKYACGTAKEGGSPCDDCEPVEQGKKQQALSMLIFDSHLRSTCDVD